MTTRVSTAQGYDSALQQLQRRQTEMTESQHQLTTGKRVNRASDDPIAAARAERAVAGLSRIEADKRGVEASRGYMEQTESALGDAGDLLQRARELLVAAGNGAYGDAQRQSISTELRGIREQLLTVANRTDGTGGYLFGGQGSARAPFVDATGGVQFAGTTGQALIAGREVLPLTLDGQAAWMSARTGNGVFETSVVASNGSATIGTGSVVNPSALTASTYDLQFTSVGGSVTYAVLKDGLATPLANVAYQPGTAIQVDGMAVTVSGTPADGDAFRLAPSTATLNVFDMMDKAVADLAVGGKRSSQVAQDTLMNLRNIDQVMNPLQAARSEVGGTLNRIDGVGSRLDGQKLAGQTERSNAEDLDMVQAISEFQNRQSGYDAALKSYSMVQHLSLFQYLNP